MIRVFSQLFSNCSSQLAYASLMMHQIESTRCRWEMADPRPDDDADPINSAAPPPGDCHDLRRGCLITPVEVSAVRRPAGQPQAAAPHGRMRTLSHCHVRNTTNTAERICTFAGNIELATERNAEIAAHLAPLLARIPSRR